MRLKERIARALDGTPVLVAYLFGSRGTGGERPWSDTDIACLLEDATPPSHRLAAEIGMRLEDAGVQKPEVHFLNGAPIVFAGEVVVTGHPVYSRDEAARVDWEVAARRRYFDFKPYLERFHRDLRERVLSGAPRGS